MMKDVSGIVAWLESRTSAAVGHELIQELCARLTAAGVPLAQAAISVTMLDPNIAARSVVWTRDRAIEEAEISHELMGSEAFLNRPLVWIQRARKPLRRRLGGDIAAEFPFLAKLYREGFTDYFATPLQFTNDEIHIASWATQQACGFSDEDLECFLAIARPLARLIEIRSVRRTEATLLETYLGRQTAARVLAGRIRRGDTESIHAAIWLSDLRGFTRLADRLPPQKLIALLNRYFECQVPAIEARGGEVLKFMGDGLLAIFPTQGKEPGGACIAALAAAREARCNILALRHTTWPDSCAEPPFSLALHVGEVLYGNVGGSQRLDFTVIGPAVNLAARLERLGGELGRSTITSAEFARISGAQLKPLGSYTLRGISTIQPVFGLPEESAAPGNLSESLVLEVCEPSSG